MKSHQKIPSYHLITVSILYCNSQTKYTWLKSVYTKQGILRGCSASERTGFIWRYVSEVLLNRIYTLGPLVEFPIEIRQSTISLSSRFYGSGYRKENGTTLRIETSQPTIRGWTLSICILYTDGKGYIYRQTEEHVYINLLFAPDPNAVLAH